jgi:formate dehydrogenase major subunit
LDYFECKLVDLAGKYAVQPERFAGKAHRIEVPEDDHAKIRRNPEKCVLCGLCARVCDEVEGKTALGLVNRGFDTLIAPAMCARLCETECDSCGLCVELCPTGALTEILPGQKPVPLKTNPRC